MTNGGWQQPPLGLWDKLSQSDEILQGVFQRVVPVHEPVSDGRDAKGRNEERQAAQTLS